MLGWLKKNMIAHASFLLSDKTFAEWAWQYRTGSELDLKNPRGFNEKIQWLKVYDRRDDYKLLSDKLEAKKFAASVIGQEHIIPTLAVFDSAESIDWNVLPDSFVMKCNHDSGGMVICRDKNALDKLAAKKKLRFYLKRNYFSLGHEWCYKGIKPKILCEALMQDERQRNSLVDYKFFCFHGKPEFLYVSEGLEDHRTASISFVDLNGKRLPFRRSDYRDVEKVTLPDKFTEMKEIAAKLAAAVNNRFVRVDLYEIGRQIYFSEFTFYPNGGFIPFEPAQWNEKIGELLHLQ